MSRKVLHPSICDEINLQDIGPYHSFFLQHLILTYLFSLSHRLAFSQVDFLSLEERMQLMMEKKPMLVSRWLWWTHSFDHLCSSLAKGSWWDMYGLAQGQRKPQHSRYSYVFFSPYFNSRGISALKGFDSGVFLFVRPLAWCYSTSCTDLCSYCLLKVGIQNYWNIDR